MITEVIVLGTSSQFPTKQRNHTSIFLRFDKFTCLFDCGEGTQRQMRILKLSPHHVNALFISHWHGDHTLGIGGILQSLSASKRTRTLEIYGPKGTEDRVNHIINTYYFKKTFKVIIHEVSPENEELIVDNKDFKITAFPLNHGIPCNGYAFYANEYRRINTEYTKKFGLEQHPLLGRLQKGEDIVFKGKKISVKKATYLKPETKVCYVIDTKYDKSLINYAKNSDLLICEATYSEEDKEKCGEYNHMSSAEAANIAKKSNSKKLLLTHISQRYGSPKKLEEEARKIFKNAVYAKDFDKVIIK
ncbi:ribonuclease Z [archaeon CG07_land_8_20_14_0_80_38_8]|nr:MAG: ribonuclease Z [archaeon CG07_land_8_20_14_0_80_38_8]PIU88249.1 MAG: ribonuclease Z [archaeon CG06_land_8_20_14_3_00_37_11]